MLTFSIITFSIIAFSILIFSIIAFSILIFSIITFSMITFSIMTFSKRTFSRMTMSAGTKFTLLLSRYTRWFMKIENKDLNDYVVYCINFPKQINVCNTFNSLKLGLFHFTH
jgi:hypothetical protein